MAVCKLMCFALLMGAVCSSTGRANENAEKKRGFPYQFEAPMNERAFREHIKRLENASRYGVDGDPDFIVDVQGLLISYPLCFHVGGQQGEVLRLLQHQNLSLFVNAKIIERNETRKTYLGSVAIIRHNVRIFATRRAVQINRYTFSWSGMTAFRLYGHRVVVGQNLLAVTFRNKNVTLVIRRHEISVDYEDSFVEPSNNVGESMSEIVQSHMTPSNHDVTSRNHDVQSPNPNFAYLGFYIADSTGLTAPCHGLLGQFVHKSVLLTSVQVRNGKRKGKIAVVSPFYSTHTFSMATLTERTNHGTGRNVTCWRLRRGGDSIVDGNYIDYMVSHLRDTEIIRFH
ncbi:inter-alpha-trypsin inhibitor heavy chain H3-like [Haliotis rufescens]|uniref:inter-alpha-trypsin inhibitor heavy chain H3-like n=1 Tax=Haliotis rufescens TaxID=6454 RepID=UPI00201F2FA2|nr:inter-alpha-trypsin inhibitor heavy chain H3-like [Haliotis rufescens]